MFIAVRFLVSGVPASFRTGSGRSCRTGRRLRKPRGTRKVAEKISRIESVYVDAAQADALTGKGIYLIVDLYNNGSISVSLDSKADDPLFAENNRDRRCYEAKTDGSRVYWPNGASLTLDEIIALLQE